MKNHTRFTAGLTAASLLIILLFSVSPAWAPLYQYVDEDGVVHVTTEPPEQDVTGTAEDGQAEDFVPETELESRYKRFKEYIDRFDVINIVSHENEAVFATILDEATGVVDSYVPGTRVGEMLVQKLKSDAVLLVYEEKPYRVLVRLKWENPTAGPQVLTFGEDEEEEQSLEELAESMRPDFHVEDMREGTMTAEVEAPSEAGGGRITWALGSYSGPKIKDRGLIKLRKELPDKVLGLLQLTYEKSGLTFPLETGVTVELRGEDAYDFGDKIVAVELRGTGQANLLVSVEKALEKDSDPAAPLRGEMVNLMIEWNEALIKQPPWLRQIIRDLAKEDDRSADLDKAVATISMDEEIWGKNFESIIRGFNRIGTEEKFKLCDRVEIGLLQKFIAIKGGYEGVRGVVEALQGGKTYLQALASMAGEKRWQPFYSEFRDFSYRELLRMPEENASILYHVGKALLDQGDLEGARLKLQQSVRNDPGNAEAQFLLGVSYMRLRLFQQAQRYVQRALEIDGGNPEYSKVFKELTERLGGSSE